MILLMTIMNVLPEKQKEVLQTLHSLIELSKNEKGCMRYEILGDIEDEHAFSLISEWETSEHLNRHMRSDQFGILLGLKSLLLEPLKIKTFTVTDTEGIEGVRSVRKKSNSTLP